MNIALFGATGGTGRQVLAQALGQGHRIQALARTPASLTGDQTVGDQGHLTVIAGDVLDPNPVNACIHGTDAVICVLGTRPGGTPIEATGTAVILAAMQRQGVRRLIAVTSMGVGDSKDQVPLFFKVLMQLALKKVMAAKEEQERLIQASRLDWTIVRPGGLTDGARTGTYRSGTDKSLIAARLTRADVADFVLQQLTDDRYLHQAPTVT
ncbi:MAG TPA: SDR family oxidoreductase [Lamprocystis sp. (in: g-proteobacteria)]|nr:SDR family oxidoreductase [Lamprocystis sp. (in: g-proteobacteria)]